MIKKGDINLIPRKKKAPVSAVFGIVMAVVLLGAVFAGGVVFSKQLLLDRKAQLEELKNEMNSYEDTQVIYFQKIQELTRLNQTKKNYDTFLNSGRETLDVFRKIDRAASGDIQITRYDFSFTQVMISGIASNDFAIANLEESLRDTGLFSRIEWGTVSGDPGRRRFIFTLIYKDSAASEGSKS